MGVKGLWRLIAPVGKPVSLESLDGKILAVDVSIWLNKAAKGMRDKHGNAVYNAHLVLMFHRICKLLFYGIKPIFVFDGGVPELKKKTLKLRKERRTKAESSKNKTKELMLKNYLQTKALEAVSGAKSSSKLNLADKKEKEDIFLLPAIPTNEESDSSSGDNMINEDEWLQTLNEHHVQEMFDHPDTVDIDSAEFSSLPAEVKHELLTEIKDSHRRRYKRKNEEEIALPEAADDFSSFQLKNLMKRGHITQQIDSLRKEMNNSMTAQFISLYEDFDTSKLKTHQIEGKRYASNERQSYILVKNVKKKEENTLFKSTLDDDYNRFKERNQTTNSHLFKKLEREPARFQTLVDKNTARKRLASDSSEDLEILGPLVETNDEAPCSSKSISNIEYISDSSSEQSEVESEDVKNIERVEKIKQNDVNNVVNDLKILEPKSSNETNLNLESTKVNLTETKKAKEKVPVIVTTSPEEKVPENLEEKNEKDALETSFEHNEVQDEIQKVKLLPPLPCQQSTIKKIAENKKSFQDSGILEVAEDQVSLVSPMLSLPSDVTSPLHENSSDVTSPLSDETSLKKVENSTINCKCEEQTEKNAEKIRQAHEEAVRMQSVLAEEQRRLEDDTRKRSRQAATLSNETYTDVQELLRIFGIPYLVSPAEAEAQCAQLNYAKLTDGSITDDSDIFLFGGLHVYKNIFNQKKFAELYSNHDLKKKLYLSREKLIALAFLTGSDYTEGVQGIGSITGMEVLQEFARSKPKETLKVFKDWVSGRVKDFNPGSNLKSKLKNVELSGTFNATAVWEAYLSPTVDTSDEPFEWSNPDIDAIKEFASEKFGWLYSRTHEILKPVMQNLAAKRKRQKTLKAYFQPSVMNNQETNVTSKRLQKILNKVAENNDESVIEEKGVSIKKKNTLDNDPDSYFGDDSIDDDLLGISVQTTSSLAGASSKQQQQSKRNSQMNESYASPSKRKKVSHKLETFSANVSTNQHVQARKVSNLIKAAEETLKPQTPFVAMQHVNNIVRNKLLKGKRSTLKRNTGKRRQKMTTSLLEAATAVQSSSVQSSSSDSD